MTENTAAPERDGVGYLRLKAESAAGALPVMGATVYVYAAGDDRPLYVLSTDMDGLTATVALPTPPEKESFSPKYPHPYSSYRVFVTKDGYYPSEGNTVPLFPGITSIQPVNLVPLSQMGGEGID